MWLDEPDLIDDNAGVEFLFPEDESKCLPLFARTNNAGQVTVIFNHPISFKYDDDDFLISMIKASGAIQV